MAMTKFTRGGSSGVDAEPLVNGQVLIDQEVGRILLDTPVDETLARVPIKEAIFTGNSTEWEALSDEEKEVYTFVNLTDDFETTSRQFTGATASTNGNAGLVTQPLAGDQNKFLKGDGSWGTPSGLIAGTEVGPTASQGYTIGQYLIYNETLYKVVAVIVQGDTLTVGTNIVSTRVADEIASHFCVGGVEYYFDYQNGKYGINTSPLRGADSFIPFKGGETQLSPLVLAYLADNTQVIPDNYYVDVTEAISLAYEQGKVDAATSSSEITQVKYYYTHEHSYLCYPEGYISRQWETSAWECDDDGTSWRTFYKWHTTCGVCGRTFDGNRTANEGWRGVSRSQSQDRYQAHLSQGRCTSGGIQCGKEAGVEQYTTDSATLGAGDTVTRAEISF